MQEWMSDDLTDEDLAFLEQWENAGHNAEEHEALELDEKAEGHGEVEIEVVGESDENQIEGESDESDSSESDEIDESKMDISQIEDGSEDYDDPGSGDEGDDEPSDDELGDYSDAEDDHLGNEHEAPDEIPEGEDDLEYDPDLEYEDGDEGQVEEEFGDGERADTDSEIEDLDEYEKEREEKEQELNADAEEDFEGDAQKELEDHLKDEQDKDEPEDQGEDESDETAPEEVHEDEDKPSEADEKSEPEPLVEQPDENQEESEDQHSGMFGNLPEAGDLCTNHCEDNPPEESLDETCPHCMERIRNERELHGAIATDMHGKDVLPGDKLRVRIPIGMIAKDSIVTANVPNMEVEPERLAVTTVGKRDKERCWLSGKGISNFTGWRMTEANNAIWTFKKGHVITFAEKIAQPLFDELDPEKMFEQLSDELDNYGQDNQESDEEEKNDADIQEQEQESDSDQSEEDQAEEEAEEPEDIEEHREKRNKEELSAAQKKRFENLTERNWKKILNTFGSTIEAERLLDVKEVGNQMRRGGSVVSRGVLYTFGFIAGKAKGDEIEEIQQWHKDREEDDAA